MSIVQYTDYTTPERNRITHSVMNVTPEMAGEWLRLGAPNRHLSKKMVKIYASDMASGRWEYNGQDIIFDNLGHLIDGQHRLHAVIESGKPVLMGVKRGLSQDVFSTIDSGKSRSSSDVIGLIREMSASEQTVSASISRFAMILDRGHSAAATRYTRREVTDYFKKWPVIADIAKVVNLGGRKVLPGTPIGVVWFMATRHGIYTNQDFMDFIDPVFSGENLTKGDPRLALRTWAINSRLKNKGRMATDHAIYAVIRAWQVYSAGNSISALSVPAGGFTNNHIPGQDPSDA
jgi:hypothetical protein